MHVMFFKAAVCFISFIFILVRLYYAQQGQVCSSYVATSARARRGDAACRAWCSMVPCSLFIVHAIKL